MVFVKHTTGVRVGMVGYGMSGSVFHAPLLGSAPRLQLAAVVTSRREKLAQDLPGVRGVDTIEELLRDREIDLVVVASPTSLHFEHAQAALNSGKHVVVDKPFTVTVREADQLIEMAAVRRRVLSVFQNRRWDNDFRTVRHCIRQGWLGRVYEYEAHYDRFRPAIKPGWREEALPGSGLLYDLGAHLIDQALVLFGMPEAVNADVFAQRTNAQMPDYFHLTLHYGRSRAILHAANLVREPGPHFAVHGDGGSFLKYGMDSQEEALKAGQRPGSSGWGSDPLAMHGVLVSANGVRRVVETLPGSYESFYRGIAASILDGAPSPVAATDARDGIRVIEACVQSARSERTIRLEAQPG
ncbi:MAG TPA: oxidoreductase [Bryobacteraceae bacterium]|nr:oxidoreductase [Bryobacteraceae bacterium]